MVIVRYTEERNSLRERHVRVRLGAAGVVLDVPYSDVLNDVPLIALDIVRHVHLFQPTWTEQSTRVVTVTSILSNTPVDQTLQYSRRDCLVVPTQTKLSPP